MYSRLAAVRSPVARPFISRGSFLPNTWLSRRGIEQHSARTGVEKSNMSTSVPAIRSNEISLIPSPFSELSSMKRRIDV
jgi:hypothetical protein